MNALWLRGGSKRRRCYRDDNSGVLRVPRKPDFLIETYLVDKLVVIQILREFVGYDFNLLY